MSSLAVKIVAPSYGGFELPAAKAQPNPNIRPSCIVAHARVQLMDMGVIVKKSLRALLLAVSIGCGFMANAMADADKPPKTFTAKDVYWDAHNSPYKKLIVAGINKIYRENKRCARLDPGTADLADIGDGSTKKVPLFFVTCYDKHNVPFNVNFTKADVESDKVLAAPKLLDQKLAVHLCEEYLKAHANHPSTVEFSDGMNLVVHEFPNTGNTWIKTSFTAKNSFNLELTYQAICMANSTGLTNVQIFEK